MICLAITEPSAGSDVAHLKTEAKKTPDGKYLFLYMKTKGKKKRRIERGAEEKKRKKKQ